MKIPVTTRGGTRIVEASISKGTARFAVDGRDTESDAVTLAPGVYSILLDGRSFEAHVQQAAGSDLIVTIDGRAFPVRIGGPRPWQRGRGSALEAQGRQNVMAAMPGKVIRLLVRVGGRVEAGQGLLVLEAMKMQNEVRSPRSGKVERLLVTEGQAVNGGDLLAVVG